MHFGGSDVCELTYALPILEEGKRAVPRVQMDPDDGPLAKAGREVHLVSFVVQQTWKQDNVNIGPYEASHQQCFSF